MKKILITGANSYIGTSFETYMKQWKSEYRIDTIDMIDGSWRESDFSQYDTVFHVAGIAHQKETKKNKELYYKVNRDLAIEVATKAKNEGVSQFLFLSSMSVYGMDTGIITKDTVPKPKSNYGKSKLQAEEVINDLMCDTFAVAIVRPPMVYGKGCKGNYVTLSKFAKKLPIFPNIDNKRSMIYIDNLSEFIRLLIDKNYQGVFCPQNKEYVKTSDMVRIIAECSGKKIILIRYFNWIVVLGIKMLPIFKKIFGDLFYEMDDHSCGCDYNVINNNESIIRSEDI